MSQIHMKYLRVGETWLSQASKRVHRSGEAAFLYAYKINVLEVCDNVNNL